MFNILQLFQQYSQFKNLLEGMTRTTGRTPEQLLNEELKRRNISRQQLEAMLQQAQQIKNTLKL